MIFQKFLVVRSSEMKDIGTKGKLYNAIVTSFTLEEDAKSFVDTINTLAKGIETYYVLDVSHIVNDSKHTTLEAIAAEDVFTAVQDSMFYRNRPVTKSELEDDLNTLNQFESRVIDLIDEHIEDVGVCGELAQVQKGIRDERKVINDMMNKYEDNKFKDNENII